MSCSREGRLAAIGLLPAPPPPPPPRRPCPGCPPLRTPPAPLGTTQGAPRQFRGALSVLPGMPAQAINQPRAVKQPPLCSPYPLWLRQARSRSAFLRGATSPRGRSCRTTTRWVLEGRGACNARRAVPRGRARLQGGRGFQVTDADGKLDWVLGMPLGVPHPWPCVSRASLSAAPPAHPIAACVPATSPCRPKQMEREPDGAPIPCNCGARCCAKRMN